MRPRSTRVTDMAYVIFGGDMFVTAFMVGLAIWLLTRENDAKIEAAARIPLEDEPTDG